MNTNEYSYYFDNSPKCKDIESKNNVIVKNPLINRHIEVIATEKYKNKTARYNKKLEEYTRRLECRQTNKTKRFKIFTKLIASIFTSFVVISIASFILYGIMMFSRFAN